MTESFPPNIVPLRPPRRGVVGLPMDVEEEEGDTGRRRAYVTHQSPKSKPTLALERPEMLDALLVLVLTGSLVHETAHLSHRHVDATQGGVWGASVRTRRSWQYGRSCRRIGWAGG